MLRLPRAVLIGAARTMIQVETRYWWATTGPLDQGFIPLGAQHGATAEQQTKLDRT